MPAMKSDRFDWTDERIATLQKLWGEGWSSGEIVKHFGHQLSRSAVIGKLHRMKMANAGAGRGVSPRTAGGQINHPGRQRRLHVVSHARPGPAAPSRGKPGGSDRSAIALLMARQPGNVVPLLPKDGPAREMHDGSPTPGAKPIAERGMFECAWPLESVAKDADASTPFCCAPVREGSSFCPCHHARAYRPTKDNADSLFRSLRRFAS